jgi:ketosteroid isomerase-like protein
MSGRLSLPRRSADYHSVMDQVRHAYEALGTGDVEPLVALMNPKMEWRGRRLGLRFWRPRPT